MLFDVKMKTITCSCVHRAKLNTLIKTIKKDKIPDYCLKKLDSGFKSNLNRIKNNLVIRCPDTEELCEIFKTPNMGYGVRVKKDLSENTKIGCYIGPLIFGKNDDDEKWIYSFQYVFSDSAIDGSTKESMTSLLNHSNKPNCNVDFEIHSVDGIEEIHLTFCLNKDVKMGEEVFIDYGEDYWRYAVKLGIRRDIKQTLITDYYGKIYK